MAHVEMRAASSPAALDELNSANNHVLLEQIFNYT